MLMPESHKLVRKAPQRPRLAIKAGEVRCIAEALITFITFITFIREPRVCTAGNSDDQRLSMLYFSVELANWAWKC